MFHKFCMVFGVKLKEKPFALSNSCLVTFKHAMTLINHGVSRRGDILLSRLGHWVFEIEFRNKNLVPVIGTGIKAALAMLWLFQTCGIIPWHDPNESWVF